MFLTVVGVRCLGGHRVCRRHCRHVSLPALHAQAVHEDQHVRVAHGAIPSGGAREAQEVGCHDRAEAAAAGAGVAAGEGVR